VRIAIVYNLLRKKPDIQEDEEAEFDLKNTIQGIKEALESGGHKVYLVEADENAYLKLKKIKSKIDLVFNISEGKRGESREAQIPAMLEMLGIPYTGSGPLSLAICLDKALTKRILLYHEIPTAKFQLFQNKGQQLDKKMKFPLFVKPNIEGSSKGIFNDAIVKDKKILYQKMSNLIKRYKQPVLVEEYLPGREFTVSILGNGEDIMCLPVVEPRFGALPKKANPIDSFESKHIWDFDWNNNYYQCPAKISKKLEGLIKKIALKTFQVLNCRDLSRIDIRLDRKGNPNVLEINPLPAIGCYYPSDFPESAEVMGIKYSQLINKIVDLACLRYKTKSYI